MARVVQLPGVFPAGRQKSGSIEVKLWHDGRVEKKFVDEFLAAWGYVVSLGGESSVKRVVLENLGSFSKGGRPYQSADWFIEDACDGGAVSADLLFKSLMEHPRRFAGKKRIEVEAPASGKGIGGEIGWGAGSRRILKNEIFPRRTINVVLVSYDLRLAKPRANGEDYAFGCRMGDLVVLQTRRAQQMYGGNAPAVFMVNSVHELAHLFGAPARSRLGDRINGVEECIGLHCRRTDCALGKANWPGRPDALEAAELVFARVERGGGFLCKACERDVSEGVKAAARGVQPKPSD